MNPYLETSLALGLCVVLIAITLVFIIRDKRRNRFPLYAVFILGYHSIRAVQLFISGPWVGGVVFGITASVAAWAIYEWWRMKRKGQPSKVLGYIRDLGHKLTVQPVPVRE